MIEIKVRDPKSEASFDKAMRQFKKTCSKDGFIQELQDRKYYIKPSQKRHTDNRLKKRIKMLNKKGNKNG